jgi:hypothetical protein
VVLKPHFLDGAFQERRLLLPQEDQAQVLSAPQRVHPLPLSTYNSFLKALPMVNHDRKHYTPCFILEEEQVILLPLRTITMKTTASCSARTATSWNPRAAAQSYTYFSSFDKMIPSLSRVTQMIAKHGRKKNYCSVCRVDYEDYLLVRRLLRSILMILATVGNLEPTSSASSYSKLRER